MLLMAFNLGSQRYAMPCDAVVEIVPLPLLRPLPKTPPYVAGVFDYRGTLVPVVDLCQLTVGQTSRSHFGTRIIVVNYTVADGSEHLLGLMAESVTQTIHREREDFEAAGVQMADAPHLGDICRQGQELVQFVEISEILSEDVQRLLFCESEG